MRQNGKVPLVERLLVKPLYGMYLKRKFRLRSEGMERVIPFKGPALVFSNHVHILDSFMISAMFPYHIRWVAGAYLFKMKALGFLLRACFGSIPKAQGRSDIRTIRDISDALKYNDIVGLFPEGTRTWDGEMMDIVGGTAKLIKMLKVSAIFISVKGGFSAHPRWAAHDRKGSVTIAVSKILTPEEIAASSKDELKAAVRDALSFSNDKWQETARVPFVSKRRAEGIEGLFYQCPCCKAYSTIQSKGERFYCVNCGAEASLDVYDRIVPVKGVKYTRLSEWHNDERRALKTLTKKGATGAVFPEDRGVLFLKSVRGKFVTLSKSFRLLTTLKDMTFTFSDGNVRTFDFSDIQTMVVNAKQSIDFFSKGENYRFRLAKGTSSLKIWELYNAIAEEKAAG